MSRIENADAQVPPAQTEREQRGDQRLANAAFARHHRHDVFDLGAAREVAGRSALRGGDLRWLISGTKPDRRACVSAREDRLDPQAVGARALLDGLVLVDAAAGAARPNGSSTSAAIGRAATRSLMFVCGAISKST